MNIELARKRAKKFFQYHNLSLPVDIESILQKYAVVEETFIPIDGDAICINKNETPHIFIKNNISTYRKRFTYAHELAHLQIPSHNGMISCTTDIPESINLTEYYEMEQEANEFAAELLMPGEWLISEIEHSANIESLINNICSTAQVSFAAAIYNIIPLLDKSYMFIITNKIVNYTHSKYSKNGSCPFLLYTDEYSYDMDWLRYNCQNIEHISSEATELLSLHFKKIPETAEVSNISRYFSDKDTCKIICNKLLSSQALSLAHLFKSITDFLEAGIILKVTCNSSGSFNYIYSNETYTKSKFKDDSSTDAWFNSNCLWHVKCSDNAIELNVWKMPTHFKMTLNKQDSRDSKTILRHIIEDNHYSKEEKVSMFGRVNGIIGSLNSSTRRYSKQQFYDILRQKFLCRIDLESITTHSDFNQYLAKKVDELYSK